MRLSVTLLDSYRYWREDEFFTEESEQESYNEIVARILGERPPQSEAMLRSIAFHEICEDPTGHLCGDVYECDGWAFELVGANALILDLPPDRVCEVKMEQQIGPVTLVGIADYIYGVIGGDQKLTKKVEPDKFGDSIQWMAYSMMADLEKFVFHVAKPLKGKGGAIRLADYAAFPFYRHPKTDERVIRLVEEFYDFAQPILASAPKKQA